LASRKNTREKDKPVRQARHGRVGDRAVPAVARQGAGGGGCGEADRLSFPPTHGPAVPCPCAPKPSSSRRRQWISSTSCDQVAVPLQSPCAKTVRSMPTMPQLCWFVTPRATESAEARVLCRRLGAVSRAPGGPARRRAPPAPAAAPTMDVHGAVTSTLHALVSGAPGLKALLVDGETVRAAAPAGRVCGAARPAAPVGGGERCRRGTGGGQWRFLRVGALEGVGALLCCPCVGRVAPLWAPVADSPRGCGCALPFAWCASW